MAWAVVHDRPDIVLRVLGYQSTYGNIAARYNLNIPLHRALMSGSFRAANALLDMGADVIYSSDSQRRSSCQRTVDWLSESGCSLLGSLALAAGARFHIGLWYNPSCTYSSERQFWTWKKRAMQKIVIRLARLADQDREVAICGADLTEYQRELDYALMEAAKSDAHSAEMMGFLLGAGAHVNREADSQIVGQTWYNVLDEEVPSLFRSKVEFLIQHGVDHSRVWSWEGVRTPVQFFLTKLHRSCQYTADSSSFVPRALYFMDFLATRGCLRWPKVTDVFMGLTYQSDPFNKLCASISFHKRLRRRNVQSLRFHYLRLWYIWTTCTRLGFEAKWKEMIVNSRRHEPETVSRLGS
ncbi:hypothetical protein LZ31DRAFT_601402 [Colletotrichum somersetense]|nr:hypothetical protein LZ31DRAFT_601402 [Colletotrichum somersetense]